MIPNSSLYKVTMSLPVASTAQMYGTIDEAYKWVSDGTYPTCCNELRQPLDSGPGTSAFSLHQLIFVATIPRGTSLLTLFQLCYTWNTAMATVKYYVALVEIRQSKPYRLYVNFLKLVVAAILGYGGQQCLEDDNGDGILAIVTASVVMLSNFPQTIPVKYGKISQEHLDKYITKQKQKGDSTKKDIKQTV